MSSSDLLDSAKGTQLESGEATFTKINDDVNVKPNVKLIGLTKEQLEEYRNDPFWKAVRYIMFALFWLVWLAMFAGAILIVVLSKKCKGGVKCDENLVNYRVFTPALFDSNGDGIGDFKGIQEKLADLRGIGISGISPTPLFQTGSSDFAPENVVDLDKIDPRLGTEEDLKNLISEAHSSDLCFIADLPLSVSADNQFALKTPASVLEKKENSVVLQIEQSEVRKKLVAVAQKLLQHGVDAIRLTDYRLSSNENAFASLNSLINEIRNLTTNDDKIKQKDIAIFVESKWNSLANTANFSDASLAKSGKDAGQFFTDIQTSVKDSKELTKPKPTWKFADVNLSRLDQILPANVQKAISAVQLIQLMLPSPISVYYGEELGLLSTTTFKQPQRGAMRWDSEQANAGFSENSSSPFYSNTTSNAKTVAFKDELADINSQLQAFKNATEVRSKASTLFSTVDDGNIHYYARLSNDEKVQNYVLAVNWPTNGVDTPVEVKIPQKFVFNGTLDSLKIKAHSSSAQNFPESVKLGTNKLPLYNYEAVLLELKFKPTN